MYWESRVCGFINKIQISLFDFSSSFPSLKKCNLKEAQNQIEVILGSWDYMAITFPLTKGKELLFSKLQTWKESTTEVYVLSYNKNKQGQSTEEHCLSGSGIVLENEANINLIYRIQGYTCHSYVSDSPSLKSALWMTELLNWKWSSKGDGFDNFC